MFLMRNSGMADFGSDVLGVLGAVAPTLAAGLGGPLAGVATSALVKALGLAPAAPAAVVSAAVANADPDQLLALKKADADFATAMKTLDVDLAKLSAADTADARSREIAIHDWTPSVLAYLLTGGFFSLLALLVFRDLPAGSVAPVNIMLGALGTGWIGAMAYFFGSSYGSKDKDQMLFQSVPASSVAAHPER